MNKETVRKQLKLNTMKHCDEHGDWKKEYQQVRVHALQSKG